MSKKILAFVAMVLLLISNVTAVETDSLSVFYSHRCPHCHEEMEFLNETVQNCSIDINFYRISKEEDKENVEILKQYLGEYDANYGGVPMTFVNDKVFLGYAEGKGNLTHNPKLNTYVGYQNLIAREMKKLARKQNIECRIDVDIESRVNPFISFVVVGLYLSTLLFFRKKIKKGGQTRRYWISGLVASFIVSFFVFLLLVPDTFITSLSDKVPFPLFVIVLALADGFNPCAFTVLFILLSLLTYTKSKKNMNLVGIIFIITSAVMYFIFIMIMVLLGSFIVEKYGSVILNVLGVFVIFAGLVNIKDYLFFKKGVSLSISDEQKKKITKKARGIVKSLEKGNNKLYAISATVLLGITVNLVELGCTAILPGVYMASLTTKYPDFTMEYILWTALYAFIYVIPLFAILANFIFTFKSERISESQGRILKLVAGVFMVVCGTIMVLKPSLLMLG